jgi:hypothetical protein
MSDTKGEPEPEPEPDIKDIDGTRKKCSYIELATANYNEISESDISYCIYCYGLSEELEESKNHIHDMDWIADKTGSTALCKKCFVDAIIPGNYFKDKEGKKVDDKVIVEQLAKWYNEGFVPHYVINFDKIKNTLNTNDFIGNDLFNGPNTTVYDGIYWDIDNSLIYEEGIYYRNIKYCNIEKIKLYQREPQWKHSPLSCIDESINDHMTQILFIIKEEFTDRDIGFMGWNSFTKKSLNTLIQENIDVYEGWDNCEEFVEMFPKKIIQFLECYCDTV